VPRVDRELEEYRNLMQAPGTFEEGFNKKTILGVLFVAIVFVPGNMYLNLMVGGSLGAAAEWVTIILFVEVAKRSFTTLKKQEVYLLYYVAASLIVAETGTFQGLIWNQYLVQSDAARGFGLTALFPHWVSPQPGSDALVQRELFHADWMPAIAVMLIGLVLARVSWFTFGYVLFRFTSDVEELPFPMAPVHAQGAMALAEASESTYSWRWKWFCSGAMLGIGFGIIYVGVPGITQELFTKPLTILPIPWVDLTPQMERMLPTAPFGITLNIGVVLAGFFLPFWMVVGTFIGAISALVVNPILYHHGYLTHWKPGLGVIETVFLNQIDFWLSFGVGTAFAVAVIGINYGIRAMRRKRKAGKARRLKWRLPPPPAGRGDFPVLLFLGIFGLATLGYIAVSRYLIGPGFPIIFFFIFGFIFTPLNSFVNAYMTGLTSHAAGIPFIREATFILSGYHGVDIWFAPIPLHNYGATTQKFREFELVGTRFTSILKAELFMIPIIIVFSMIYWSYIWKLGPIPSERYPYAQQMWRFRALNQCLWYTGTVYGEQEARDGFVRWKPPALQNDTMWYWRVRLVAETDKTDPRGLPVYDPVSPWSPLRATWVSTSETDPGPRVLKDTQDKLRLDWGLAPPSDTLPMARLQPPEPAQGMYATTKLVTPELAAPAVELPSDRKIIYQFQIDVESDFGSSLVRTSQDVNWLRHALKPKVIGAGFVICIVLYAVMAVIGLPIMLIFGFIRSIGNIPHIIIPEILGALLGRYYFAKKYGRQQWRRFALVLAVGFSCGMGLVGMFTVAFAMISKSVSTLTY